MNSANDMDNGQGSQNGMPRANKVILSLHDGHAGRGALGGCWLRRMACFFWGHLEDARPACASPGSGKGLPQVLAKGRRPLATQLAAIG
jgi:hypothetical protein